MTTELPKDHSDPNALEPLALKSNDGLGLVERLRTDVLWHQRRGTDQRIPSEIFSPSSQR